jgi:hypothetical protein
VRRILTWTFAGALVGIIITTWVGPRVLTWWFTPPAGVMLTNASEAVRWGMDRLVHAQIISLLVGAIIGLVLGMAVRRRADVPPPREPAMGTPAAASTKSKT